MSEKKKRTDRDDHVVYVISNDEIHKKNFGC